MKVSQNDRRNLPDADIPHADREGRGSIFQFLSKVLGFKNIFTMPGPDGKPSLVHLRWVKYADLLITKSRDGKELAQPKGVGVSLNFNMLEHFNGDMDAFAKHVRENGAKVT